jgi:hypothetical protein
VIREIEKLEFKLPRLVEKGSRAAVQQYSSTAVQQFLTMTVALI